MKGWHAGAVMAAAAALVAWGVYTQSCGHDGAPAVGKAKATAETTKISSPAAEAPQRADVPQQVRKVSREDRRRLAEQIAAARAKARPATARASTAPTAPTAPTDDTITVEQVGPEVKRAMEAAIPILAECYRDRAADAGLRVATVQMVMTSDPELGTVIDTAQMTDEAGQPLDSKLDDCLRSTIESLELPPLGTGGRLPLQYSFRFD